jgi:hypothetical protein
VRRRDWRKWAAAALFLCAVGFAYERFGEWRDNRKFPQIGRSVDIGGRSLNLHCAGSGGPAVILDSGGNQPGYSWALVARLLAPEVRVCWYDRAGYGWSDPAPGTHDSERAADDLYRLLHSAGVAPPYILVGHSYDCVDRRNVGSAGRAARLIRLPVGACNSSTDGGSFDSGPPVHRAAFRPRSSG